VAAHSSGAVYASGVADDDLLGEKNAGNRDVFFVKYDSTGMRQWFQLFGTSDYDFSTGISIAGTGDLFISGATYGADVDFSATTSKGKQDGFAGRFDGTGKLEAVVRFGSAEFDTVLGVAGGEAGTMLVSGVTEGDLGGPNIGGRDAYFGSVTP